MKTIVEINGTNYGSTGNIALSIAKQARTQGFEVFTCCKNSRKSQQFNYENQIYIGSRLERVICEELSEILSLKDRFNIVGTYFFIKKLKKIKPDLVHLHIMHDTYINIKMIFNYLSKYQIPVIWTFHDCWALTGQCASFNLINCNKWQNGCHKCELLNRYPKSVFFDNTKHTWKLKKKLFNSIKDITIITPSIWMSNFVKNSFLKNYPVRVINNGINKNIFKYNSQSGFRKQYNLQNKKIVLSVTMVWSKAKGLFDMIEISKMLPKDYCVVLVGTNTEIDKTLPNNIVSIHRTDSQQELADIYSAADVFVIPTYNDNFPTVNLESISCGTPVITYNTGGSPETIDETCGVVVEKGNINELKEKIIYVCENKPFSREDCVKASKKYNGEIMINKYIDLYNEILRN